MITYNMDQVAHMEEFSVSISSATNDKLLNPSNLLLT